MIFPTIRQQNTLRQEDLSLAKTYIDKVDIVNHLESSNSPWIGEDKRYRLIERLGGGGMGNVYLAMDTRIGKPVALKLLKESLADDESIKVRFEWELAICAALKSQHIVQVTDYGVTPEGYPFYVMEYLQGQTLGQLLAQEESLSPQRACQIVTQICAGLQVAHEGVMFAHQGTDSRERIKVVHRDLKPENIFLVPSALGELVKIIDFGIAKIRSLHTEQTNITNAFLGTCHYTAPEQIKGANNLDDRADIYNLGLMLYEMLSGCDPFGFDYRQNRVSGDAWLLAHVSQEPISLRSQSNCQYISLELEAAVMRCLQKSPNDRFSSVNELSKALQSVVSGSAVEIEDAEREGRGEGEKEGRGEGEKEGRAEEEKTRKDRHLKWLPIGIGAIAVLAMGIYSIPKFANSIGKSAIPTELAANNRQFSVAKVLSGHTDAIWAIALSGDGQTLASGSEDKTVKVWNPKTGQLKYTFSSHSDAVRAIALSRDGHLLVSGSSDRTIKLWNLKTGKFIRTLVGHRDTVWSVAISPDRRYLASASADGTIKLWNIHTKELLRTLKGHTDWVFSVAFSPDGQTLASGSKDGTIKLWNVQTGMALHTLMGHREAVRAVAFEGQGKHLASASWDGTVKIWDLATRKELVAFSGHTDRLTSVAFSPDGKMLASSSIDGTIKLWDWERQKLLGTLKGHDDWVLSVIADSSGQTLISSSRDKTLKIWRR